MRDAFELIKVMWVVSVMAIIGFAPIIAVAGALYWWCK